MSEKFDKLFKTESKVDVSRDTLKYSGFTEVIARPGICSNGISVLKKEIMDCEKAHSWKSISIDSFNFDTIVDFENGKRPSFIFSYYGDGETFLGTGCISSKISHSFSFEGFPIISRAFIQEDFRNIRLYEPILCHRIKACEALIGDNLLGIHFGSNNPRIFSLVRKNSNYLGFNHIGSEILKVNNNSPLVHDFLKPYPNFFRSISNELATISEQVYTKRFQEFLFKAIQGEFGERTLKYFLDHVESINQRLNLNVLEASNTSKAFLEFLKHIPVLETDKQLTPKQHFFRPERLSDDETDQSKKVG